MGANKELLTPMNNSYSIKEIKEFICHYNAFYK